MMNINRYTKKAGYNNMAITIRHAESRDLDKTLKLLSEVLELHAKIRPDIFISGTTKYTREELQATTTRPRCLSLPTTAARW